MNLSDRIQSLRKAQGLSQEELADRLGVSRQAVSKWEGRQSQPDLDRIIAMSGLFHTTTDYLLKGVEPGVPSGGEGRAASRILYIASCALVYIGLFAAFGGWYEEQSMASVWGAMIIQATGLVAYFIGRTVSRERPGPAVQAANLLGCAFMPISMIAGFIICRLPAPYPSDVKSAVLFIALYLLTGLISFRLLKKRGESEGKAEKSPGRGKF